LHGGRPGNESCSVSLADPIDRAIRADKVGPVIYVFPNGGLVSHYDSAQHDSYGERVFVDELIPYIERTYHTLPGRAGRALQGFSQGGRGTARIVFRRPELFCSAAPGGGGYVTERSISDSGGIEDTPTALRNYGGPLRFAPEDNVWDLAAHAAETRVALPPLLVWVGTNDFNYEANLDYLRYLEGLGMAVDRLVVPNAGHHPGVIYASHGVDIMTFHERVCDWLPGSSRPERFQPSSSVEETLARHAALPEPDEEIWWRQTGQTMAWRNRHVHQFAPTVTIYRGGQVSGLRSRPMPEIAGFELTVDGESTQFDELLRSGRSTTMGLVVLHRGEVVFETYSEMQPHERPIWWSVTKVLTGNLVGILEDRGLIDVDQPVEHYVPELTGSDYEGVRVRDILDMASGVDCPDGDYSDPTTCYMQLEASLGDAERTADSPDSPYAYLANLDVGRWAEPGTGFDYSGANTVVLGWAVEKVTGVSFHDAVSREIWTLLGAEHDAAIYAARSGIPLTSGGLLATPRDVARFGLLFTPSAVKTAQRPVVSSRHVEHLRSGGRPDLLRQARFGGGRLPDGVKHNVHQWDRVFENNDLYKGGWAGRGLLVNPDRDLVAVWVGYQSTDGQDLRMLPIVRRVLNGVFDE